MESKSTAGFSQNLNAISSEELLKIDTEMFNEAQKHLNLGFAGLIRSLQVFQAEISSEMRAIHSEHCAIISKTNSLLKSSMADIEANRATLQQKFENFSQIAGNLRNLEETMTQTNLFSKFDGPVARFISRTDVPVPFSKSKNTSVSQPLTPETKSAKEEISHSEISITYKSLPGTNFSFSVLSGLPCVEFPRCSNLFTYDLGTSSSWLLDHSHDSSHSFPSVEKPRKTCSVYYFPVSYTEANLKDLFSKFGEIVNVTINRNEAGKSLRSGTVEFKESTNAATAASRMDRYVLEGKFISVSLVV